MAYQLEQIQKILTEVISVFKSSQDGLKSAMKYQQRWRSALNKGLHQPAPADAYEEEVLPDYYPSYAKTVEWMERIRIHAEHGIFPYRLFSKRSPNQTDIEYNYIKANYKQVTLPFTLDYLSTVNRAFSDPNCGVKFAEDDAENKTQENTLKEYLEEQIPDYGSIEAFMKGIVPALKAVDANGVIVIKPNQLFTTTVISGYDEFNNPVTTTVKDDTQLQTPIPYYFSSRQVVQFEEGDLCMVELNDKSVVNFGNQKLRMGKIYEFYDAENIWKITQVNDYSDFEFVIELWYNHAQGKLPVTRLKGIPRILNDELVWQSPLLYPADILDLVILNSSNLQVSINMCVYPYRIMYGDECEFQGKDGDEIVKCSGGNLYNGAMTPLNRVCPQCNGTGLKSRLSPMGVTLLKPPTRESDGDSKLTHKPMDYVSPDVTSLEFLVKKIKDDYAKALDILHLRHANVNINPGNADNVTRESATQIASGLKALYAFVKTVSDQTFDIYQFIVDAIGWQRYGANYQQAVVKYPTTFDFADEMDYVAQLSELSKYNNIPPFVYYGIIYRYLQALNNDDKDAAGAAALIVETDRLLTLSNADIQIKLTAGTAEKWEDILHTSAPTFVNQLVKNFNPTCKPDTEGCIDSFFEQDMKTQKEALIKLAKDRAAEIKTATPAITSQTNLIKNIASGNHNPVLTAA